MKNYSKTQINRISLPLYFALAYLFTWSIAIPLAASNQGWVAWKPPFWIHYFVAFGPMLSAILVTALTEGAAGLGTWLRNLVRPRIAWPWWLMAISPLIAYGLFALLLRLAQGSWPEFQQLGQVNYLPNLGGAALLLWVFTFGLGEELGWRGFALPRLQTSHSALGASLILWVFWAFWHWPMFFYIYEPGAAPMIVLGMLAGTIYLTWLFNSTRGNILIVILWHGTYDFITASKAGEGLTAAIVTALVMVWALVVVIWFKPANLSHRPKVEHADLARSLPSEGSLEFKPGDDSESL